MPVGPPVSHIRTRTRLALAGGRALFRGGVETMRKLMAGGCPALVLVVTSFFVIPGVALGQEPAATTQAAEAEPEVTRPWVNEGELMFVNTSGNSSSSNFGFRDRFTYNFTYSELILYVSLIKATARETDLYNEGGGVRAVSTTRTTTEQYEAGAKYRQNFMDQAFWYALGTWYANDPSGISSRLSGGGGIGYRFAENDTTTLIGELGLALTNESQTNDTSDTFIDARAYGQWKQRLSETTDLELDAEFIDNLQNTKELRINTHFAVTARMTRVLALRASWEMRFNNDPPSLLVDVNPDEPPAYYQLRTSDRVIGASLVFSF